MAKILTKCSLVLFFFTTIFYSCADKCTDTFLLTTYEPIYKSKEEARQSFAVLPPQEIKNPGKLYVFGDFLFVVDEYIGFHVIDNRNPSLPIPLNFIVVYGCTDVVVSDYFIYANRGSDLITISKEGDNYNLVDQDNDVFVGTFWQSEVLIGYDTITEWVTSEEYNCEGPRISIGMEDDAVQVDFNVVGVGGSTARMTIVDDYIYSVDEQNLLAIDISNRRNPGTPSTTNLSNFFNVIETIYPMNGYLFIGTTTGMEIFNYKDNPSKPIHESTANHVSSCDPVIVQNNIAYVTTHGGTRCGGNNNVLLTYDVSNVKEPVQLAQFEMTFPLGLGIDGNVLFICEEDFGLKIYNATDPQKITSNLLSEIKTIRPVDVIPIDGLLIVTAKDGVYQYDYSDPTKLVLLSKVYDIKEN